MRVMEEMRGLIAYEVGNLIHSVGSLFDWWDTFAPSCFLFSFLILLPQKSDGNLYSAAFFESSFIFSLIFVIVGYASILAGSLLEK